MSQMFSIKVPSEVFATVDVYRPMANDRRNAVNLMFDNWFSTNHMKLGRDYYLTFVCKNTELDSVDQYWRRAQIWYIDLEIKDNKKAVLFKLACI